MSQITHRLFEDMLSIAHGYYHEARTDEGGQPPPFKRACAKVLAALVQLEREIRAAEAVRSKLMIEAFPKTEDSS